VRFINGGGANTGACTLNVNSVGAVAIRKGLAATALAAGDLPADALVEVVHDGTVFRLLSVQPSSVGLSLARASSGAGACTVIGAADLTASGQVFTQAIGFGDADHYAQLVSDQPSLYYAAGDRLYYDRSDNQLVLEIGTTPVLRVDSGGILAGTAVIQRAYVEYSTNTTLAGTAIPYDDTVPLNTEGSQIISTSFTPRSDTSRLRIRVTGFGELGDTSGAARVAPIAIFAGSTCLHATAALACPANTTIADNFTIETEYAPGSTSAVTISVRIGPDSLGNVTLRLNGTNSARRFGGAAKTTMVIEEVI
jgi:hypothetical protein